MSKQQEQLDREIKAAQRKLKLLNLQKQKIEQRILTLKKTEEALLKSVRQTLAVYIQLEKDMLDMTEIIPFTDEEQKEMQNELLVKKLNRNLRNE